MKKPLSSENPLQSSAGFRIDETNKLRQDERAMNTDLEYAVRVDWRHLDAAILDEAESIPRRTTMDRSHAVFAIAGHLRALGLRNWVGRIVQWLSRYDGLEEYVEPEDEPLVCVRDVLFRHVCRIGRWVAEIPPCHTATDAMLQLKNRIIDDLLKLNFVRYAAFWGDEPVPSDTCRRWQPLQQSWLEFLESRQEGDHLWIWQRSEGPNPSEISLREYLLHES